MTRLCERPGCSNPAAVAYGMDSDRLLVWLEAMSDDGSQRRPGAVCRQHADAMVVPRGWTLDDRRESRPRLFRVPDAVINPRPSRRAVHHREPDTSGEPQSLFDVQIATDVASVAASPDPLIDAVVIDPIDDELTVGDIRPLGDLDPDETQAMKWRPVFDDGDDLGGLLKATSPLLSRAFRGRSRDTDRPT